MPTGAEIVAERLHHQGVRTLFGMPGSHSTAIYDAVKRHGRIQTILVRNEQAGAFMADGYARVSGRPGVVCTTAGPGATNALTGIGEAWADSIPILLVAGQVNHDRLFQECGNYHEIDLEGIFSPCTKFTGTVMAVEEIAVLIDRAFAAMTVGRPRPAALFFPQDLMTFTSHFVAPTTEITKPSIQLSFPEGPVRHASEVIGESKRPILVAGGGAVAAGASDTLRQVARRIGAPVVTTTNGKGILSERDPLSLGHMRSARAKAVLNEADLMIAVGCRFTEVTTDYRTLRVPRRLIQIDIDPGQIGMNYPVEVGITADAQVALLALLEQLPKHESAWADVWENARGLGPERPEWLIDTLRAELPENAIVFADACEMGFRMQTDFPALEPRSFFYPANFITLGWGFPAAIGGAIAAPGRPVVCVAGDGGFTMAAQELATAARYSLPVIAVVHNDSTYGAIKNIQKNKHEARYLDTDLNNPDFLLLAQAYGVPASRVRNADELAAALRLALKRQGPTLIEVVDSWRYLRG